MTSRIRLLELYCHHTFHNQHITHYFNIIITEFHVSFYYCLNVFPQYGFCCPICRVGVLCLCWQSLWRRRVTASCYRCGCECSRETSSSCCTVLTWSTRPTPASRCSTPSLKTHLYQSSSRILTCSLTSKITSFFVNVATFHQLGTCRFDG